MAKKTRKQMRRSSGGSSSAGSASSRSFDRDFDPDYTPVIKDLKRIGTLAGGFIIVLIILSFIL